MKKLGRIEVSSKKMLNNVELTTLKGSDGTGCCYCTDGYIMGGASSKEECIELCSYASYGAQSGVWKC